MAGTATTIRKIGEAAYNLYYLDRAKTPDERIESFMAALEDIAVITVAGLDDALCAYLQASIAVPHCRSKLKDLLTLLCQPATNREMMHGARRRRKEYDTEFPNEAAARAAAIIDSEQTEQCREELIECLRELHSFGRDEDFCRDNNVPLKFEGPASGSAPLLSTILAFAEDGQSKCQEKMQGVDTESEEYGFSLFLFLLLQVIAVYIRRWLDKVLP